MKAAFPSTPNAAVSTLHDRNELGCSTIQGMSVHDMILENSAWSPGNYGMERKILGRQVGATVRSHASIQTSHPEPKPLDLSLDSILSSIPSLNGTLSKLRPFGWGGGGSLQHSPKIYGNPTRIMWLTAPTSNIYIYIYMYAELCRR